MLPRINTLWVEGRLSYLEHLCLLSMLKVGHEVTLFTYFGVENVPEGVVIEDGRKILPVEKMLKHKKRESFAVGADIFRYSLMKADLGIWLDMDVYCLHPIKIEGDYLFGSLNDKWMGNAVLYLPPDSVLLNDLLELCNLKPFIPPWWSAWKKLVQHARSLTGKDRSPAELKYSILGPIALTYFVRQHGLINAAHPPDVFYPVHYKQADIIFDPKENVSSYFTGNTLAIHFWNEAIKKRKHQPPPEGSFLDQLCRKHDIRF